MNTKINIKEFLENNKNELLNHYEDISSVAKAVRKLCNSKGVDYTESFRAAASKVIHSYKDTENFIETDTNQYNEVSSDMPSAWDKDKNKYLSIEEFCDKYGLDKTSVKSSKLVSHNASHMTYNIAFYTKEEVAVEEVKDSLEDTVKKYIFPVSIPFDGPKELVDTDTFDRLVYTDTHIGMDVNGSNNTPMYDGKWDKEELLRRLDIMIAHTIKHQQSSVLYIDELGDFMDGLDAETTRKGHHLPQNMTNQEAFDLGVMFKVKLVESLLNYYENIVCHSITNDNHSGDFAYFVNATVKNILELKHKRVKYNIITRFMDYYTVGKHKIILSHGKDSGEMKFGFKPFLDPKQAEKIDQYCKAHNLYGDTYIEFSKGDSHQSVVDETTSNDFDYCNYPAFSPPSNWVKTNFKDSRSGFKMFTIERNDNIKSCTPKWF